MLYACMFSAIIGQLSPGAVYLSQTLDFKKPVTLGDTVTAEIEVERVAARGRLLDFQTRCYNQHSEVVLSGQARHAAKATTDTRGCQRHVEAGCSAMSMYRVLQGRVYQYML